jgi:CRP-like cAMP-binding protein
MQKKRELPESVKPVLKEVKILSGFSDAEIEKISANCMVTEYHAGDIIMEENTPASEIFIVLKGRVSIYQGPKNDSVELIEFGPGGCIGEVSVIGILNHSASAIVTEDVLLLVLSRNSLMEIFNSDKELFSMLILNIARELARRLFHTNEILMQYGKHCSKKSSLITPQSPL